ncbi:MAG TPA: AarF/UbiB family protein [Acidimicrobiales bacterium]|jgi:predicted unusual protein kinase regulating ubiquinone biosynthesis (AarF/ABC1/UbiB family)|nr:AarF/UbiB family protein [Acidimicrobiales bacterium]
MQVSEAMSEAVTVGPDDRLVDAAKALRSRGASAAVVVDHGRPIGVLTERDFLQTVIDGTDPMAPVRQAMTAEVVSLAPHDDLDKMRDLCARHSFRHVPVIHDGQLLGMVSLDAPGTTSVDADRRPAGDFGSSGVVSRFRGPYADGPPAADLEIDTPDLDKFRFAEIRRMVVIVAVLGVAIARRVIARVARGKVKEVHLAAADGMVDGFEQLGPTFVKIGQLIASSPGVFPQFMSDAALRCLNDVPPFDGETAAAMIRKDLGRSPHQLFKSFDETPLSAASIGQVHAAVLPDGREAVIKLQRPNIRKRMTTDLRVGFRLARLLERHTKFAKNANVTGIITDLHAVTFQELVPALEASRQDRFRNAIGAFGDNTHITAPEIYWEYCGPHMICMERMSGVPMDQVDAIRSLGVDGEVVLRRGVKVWLEAIAVHGPFHGDVHAGNLWVLDDGRGSFLDFGIMGELAEEWKQLIRDLFHTSMIDGDFSRIARAFKRVGAFPEDVGTDEEVGMRMEMAFGPMLDVGISSVSLADVFNAIFAMMEGYGVPSPQELVLVVKQLLYFERYAKVHAPDWALARDIFLVKNIFPDEVAKKVADEGLTLPD